MSKGQELSDKEPLSGDDFQLAMAIKQAAKDHGSLAAYFENLKTAKAKAKADEYDAQMKELLE